MDSSNSDVVAQVCGISKVVLSKVTLRDRRLILEAAISQCKPLKYFPGFRPLRQIISDSGLYPSERISIEPRYQVTGDTKLFMLAEILPQIKKDEVGHLAFDQEEKLHRLVWKVDLALPEHRLLQKAKTLSLKLLDEVGLENSLGDPRTLYQSLALLLNVAEEDARQRKSRSERSDEIARNLKGMWDRCSTSR